MPPHPFTHLLISSSWVVAISRYSINVLDAKSGAAVCSLSEDSQIIAAALDNTCSLLVAVDESKQLRVWDIMQSGELKLKSTRTLNKKPSCLILDEDTKVDDSYILVGDKFGDVFRFPLHPPPKQQEPSPSEDTIEKKDKIKEVTEGELLLGHVSILTSLLLSGPRGSTKRCIITADRDEHIRVSRYPQSFVVEGWCLGSKSFVNALHLLSPPPTSPNDPQLLLSGGGEDEIRVWDWRAGKCLGSVEIGKAVRPFLRVKRSRGRRGAEDDAEGVNEEEQDVEMDDRSADETDCTLAVQKVVSIQSDTEQCVIFSAIGASALFSFELRTGFSPEDLKSVKVSASTDIGEPVLDFMLIGSEVIVSVDVGERHDQTIRLLRWEGSNLSLGHDSDTPLVEGLNMCVNVSEDPTPDYYQLLDLLPKSPSQPVVIPQPAPNAAGGRKGLKKAAREGLRKVLSAKSNPGEEAEAEPEVKKSRLEEA